MEVGIDEAGRGPWAGPLVVAAVCLKVPLKGLSDSKRLSPKAREHLYELIIKNSIYATKKVSAKFIDKYGLTRSTQEAMLLAYSNLGIDPDLVIIDGNINYLSDVSLAKAVVKADSLYQSVMAASILAKVTRDKYMIKLAGHYPKYGFERHKGYGTQLHKRMLVKYGPTSEHRLSYKPLKELI